MKLWSHYQVVHSVDEAIHYLGAGDAQIVAGGTDLLLDIQQGNHPPANMLVDITQIPEMTTIENVDNLVTIGAGVTHNTIVSHPLLRSRATCLVESCGVVGGPQVRNVATIGGNVAHALPAADGTLSLVALWAQAEIASAEGRIWRDMADLFHGPGQSAIDPTRELITRFRFRLCGAHESSAFRRIMRPQGVALPILGCAVHIALDTAGAVFERASICLGPVGPTPSHAAHIESLLIGQPATPTIIHEAARAARQSLVTRTSKYRATAEYRTEMVELLLNDALSRAVQRARTGESVPEIGI